MNFVLIGIGSIFLIVFLNFLGGWVGVTPSRVLIVLLCTHLP